MKKIVLWGATGQAIVIEEFLMNSGYKLVAVFDNNTSVKSPFPSVPIYHGIEGYQKWRAQYLKNKIYCVVTIGGEKGADRVAIQKKLENSGLIPIPLVHPASYVANNASIHTKTYKVLAVILVVSNTSTKIPNSNTSCKNTIVPIKYII